MRASARSIDAAGLQRRPQEEARARARPVQTAQTGALGEVVCEGVAKEAAAVVEGVGVAEEEVAGEEAVAAAQRRRYRLGAGSGAYSSLSLEPLGFAILINTGFFALSYTMLVYFIG